MAINKKLIHFNTKANFDKQLANNNILDTSICFIKDAKQIYTHGGFYGGEGGSVNINPEFITGESSAILKLSEDSDFITMGSATESKAGLLSASDKNKLDSFSNPDEYYGIKWTTDENGIMNSSLSRTGNMNWHASLPIQSKMRRCTLQDDGTVYGYVSDDDYTKYEDGSDVDYSGSHGQVMVEIPEYYYEATSRKIDGGYIKELRLYPYAKIGEKSKRVYVSASEAMSDIAKVGKNNAKLYSVCKSEFNVENNSVYANTITYTSDASDFKGGNRDSTIDDTAVSSLLGRPVASINIVDFRTIASRRGEGWSQQYWAAYSAILRLYVIEYCNFNSQAAYNANLTSEGYHQGGLGNGVTNVNYSLWTTFNKNNPLIPCLFTKSLGNNTGFINFKYEIGEFNETNEVTIPVISYRGVENIFGHVWKFTDGIYAYKDQNESKTYIYACDDITKFATPTNNVDIPDGYVLRTVTEFGSANNYIKNWLWDKTGDFIPTEKGGTSNTYLYDYWHNSNAGVARVISGGSAYNGSAAGLFAFASANGFSLTGANYGARLYYTPKD